jgi:hypothetical protein
MTLRSEIEKRAHFVEGQGDGIYMVLIRMDEIIRAVSAFNRAKKAKKPRRKQGNG